jgi:hypothetical protein
MIFLKIFFGIWLAQKNYKMQKSEFGKCRWNSATSGRRCRIPATKFGQIRLASDHGWNLVSRHPATVAGCRRIPGPAGFQRPNVAVLQRQLDSDDQQLHNSDHQISNVHTKTKSLISEKKL